MLVVSIIAAVMMFVLIVMGLGVFVHGLCHDFESVPITILVVVVGIIMMVLGFNGFIGFIMQI